MRSRVSRVSLAVVLTVSLAAAGHVSAEEALKVRIDNFGKVDDSYYRGAQPKGRDYRDLSALGVKVIVNLTSDDADPGEKMLAEQAGIRYVQIPMTTRVVPTAEQLDRFLTIVRDPGNQPVFVHCVGGKHRTGVMTAVYRIVNDGWDAARAFAEMKQYKFGADFLHPEFKRFVFGFPETLASAGGAQPVSR